MSNFRYTLRAHHGMCLFFFRGKGYSQQFIDNMSYIKSNIANNPIIKIVAATEDICCCCPNNVNNKCVSFKKVLSYDNAVLQTCGLKSGSIMHFSDFEKLVYEKIILSGNREKICGDCQWSEVCH